MSQTDRKYDGPTIQERRQGPHPEPPPPKYHKKKGKNKGPIVTTDVYIGWQSYGWPWDSHALRRPRLSPFSGIESRGRWGNLWSSHVIKRLKALVKLDTRTGLVWLECQATKAQLSPEFSTRDGLIYWLEFEGLRRGWLTVETHVHTWGGKEHRNEFYKEH